MWCRDDTHLLSSRCSVQWIRILYNRQGQVMRKFPKPCRTCGTLSLNALCPTHQAEVARIHDAKRAIVKKQTGQYSGDYKRRAKQVRDTALTCHICGDSARYNDPFEADHLIPGDPSSPLAAAHRSCNIRRSNTPLAE